jgi:hypothetical protein
VRSRGGGRRRRSRARPHRFRLTVAIRRHPTAGGDPLAALVMKGSPVRVRASASLGGRSGVLPPSAQEGASWDRARALSRVSPPSVEASATERREAPRYRWGPSRSAAAGRSVLACSTERRGASSRPSPTPCCPRCCREGVVGDRVDAPGPPSLSACTRPCFPRRHPEARERLGSSRSRQGGAAWSRSRS